MRAGNTSAFNCRPVTGNPYRVSPIPAATPSTSTPSRTPTSPVARVYRVRLAATSTAPPPYIFFSSFTFLDEDWERALCVVAHPDDMEFGAAAAVARWTGQGKRVVYCMVTSGEAGIDGMVPTSAAVREAEQVESARIVGVDTVDFLGLPDGVIEYGVPLRRESLAGVIRRYQPEIVLTNNFRDLGRGHLNQADHIATGKATLDAVRDAGNRWVFPRAARGRAAGAVGRRE